MSSGLQSLIEFDGAVDCSLPSGAVNLALRGRAGNAPVEALFAGAATELLAGLPPTLHAVSLFEYGLSQSDTGARRFRLQSQELQLDLAARSLQLHRDVARAFFGAVPPPRVPLGRRLGWTALLLLLRIPGAERLLVRLRGRA